MQLRKRILSFLLASVLVSMPSMNAVGAVSGNDVPIISETDETQLVDEESGGDADSDLEVVSDETSKTVEESQTEEEKSNILEEEVKPENSEEKVPDDTEEEKSVSGNLDVKADSEKESIPDETKEEKGSEAQEVQEKEESVSLNRLKTVENKKQKVSVSVNQNIATDFVIFNTGKKEYVVNTASNFGIKQEGLFFDRNGNFTIEIPEENPFFPYEVQFQYRGETVTKWFMTPQDSVTIGEYTFYVEPKFDGTAVTQMSLEVAGKTVVAYPARKVFTNHGQGDVSIQSLLPLEEREIVVDLSGFTPVELTMVSVKSMFSGENQINDTDSIMWKYMYDDNYQINTANGKLDLSYNVSGYAYSSEFYFNRDVEMLVGEKDQLAASNIKYYIDLKMVRSADWLKSLVYFQDDNSNRISMDVFDCDYDDAWGINNKELKTLNIKMEDRGGDGSYYMNLVINNEVFPTNNISQLKAFEGNYYDPNEALKAKDVTEQVFSADMEQAGNGYQIPLSTYTWITVISYDQNGNVSGCIPIRIYVSVHASNIESYSFKSLDGKRNVVNYNWSNRQEEDYILKRFELYKDEEAFNENYVLTLNYNKKQTVHNELVTAAYEGNYATIAEANSKGATDIKDSLFNTGYEADYKKGVLFSIFIGEDGSLEQEVYKYKVVAEVGDEYYEKYEYVSSSTNLSIYSLLNNSGDEIKILGQSAGNDSYGENNQYLVLVPEGTDLTNIAMEFYVGDGAKLYAAGSSTPEVSKESCHDYSKGAIQFTVVAEDGKNQKNYWISIMTASEAYGKLYINSFDNADSNTRIENGIVYSTREVLLDSYHGSIHDIWMANIGNAPIDNLSVTLESDSVILDEYWTLYGKHSLAGVPTGEEKSSNMAKIRLHKKEEAAKGSSISGTLTIKSGDKTLVVLTLTGTVGDPSITTLEVPEAVKYVPYGTVIQNSNKYSWNQTTYSKLSGTLPQGMEIKPNGELYGVPKESGSFTFKVRMTNSYRNFGNDTREYTLVIKENTDANVDAETDIGYELSEKIQTIDNMDTATGTQTMVSAGEFIQFVDIYLDGVALVEVTDYTKEEGSTRITINNQTLVRDGKGTHTLGIEFRTTDTDTLQCAAQNYQVKQKSSGTGTGSGVGAGNKAPGQGESSDSATNVTTDGSNPSGGSEQSGNNSNEVAYVSTMGEAWNPVTLTVGNTAANTGTTNTNTANTTEVISYTIVAGDTLSKIARELLGDANRWREIAEYNKAIIRDPNRIYVGQVIQIVIVRGAENRGSNENTPLVLEGLQRTYVVQRGDSLWKISRKLYGTARYWRQIFDANRNIISQPSKIQVGQVLLIP